MQDAGHLMLAANPLSLQLLMGLYFVDTCAQSQADVFRYFTILCVAETVIF